MIIRLILLLLLLPGGAFASVAHVTSGEHADFSRLVITLPQVSEWKLGRIPDGYTLDIAQKGLRFDLSDAFRRIPRTRLADLAQPDGTSRLNLSLACRCHIRTFAFRPNIIVIDIRNGAPPEGSEYEKPLDLPARAKRVPAPEPQMQAAMFIPDPAVQNPLAIDRMRAELTRAIRASAANGVIELGTPQDPPTGTIDNPAGIRRQFTVHPPGKGPSPVTISCIPDDLLEFAPPDSRIPIAKQLYRLRTGLLDKNDRFDRDAVLSAARFHIALAFGAEAIQLLDTAELSGAEPNALKDIALLIEGAAAVQGSFQNAENCGGRAALWAVLARENLRKSEPVNGPAISRSFRELPPPLRRAIARPLIRRISDIGDLELLSAIEADLARIDTAGSATLMARATLKDLSDQPEHARQAYERAAAKRDGAKPHALIALVRIAAKQDQRITMELAQDVELAWAEYRESDLDAKLEQARFLAFALAGDFEQAGMDRLDPEIWAILAKAGTDTDLIGFAIGQGSTAIPALPVETRMQIAQRMLDLGLPEEAGNWLEEKDLSGGDEPVRMLAAKIGLAQRDGRVALKHLAGLSGMEADRLRSRALIMLGQYAEAAEPLSRSDAGMEITALRQAGAWHAVAEKDSGIWARSAADRIAVPQAPDLAAKPLTAARELLQQSARSRQLLQELAEEAPP